MNIVIDNAGDAKCVYDEAIDLTELGTVEIQRASHVEPTADGEWLADLSPVDGPLLGPFAKRSEALAAEREWLDVWLVS